MYRKTAARSCAQGVISPPSLNTGQVEPSRNSYTESKEVESGTLCALKFKLKPPGIQTRRLGSVRGHSPPSLSALCPWLPFSVPSCPPSLNSLPGCSLHTSPSTLASLPPLSLPHPCTVSKLPKPTFKNQSRNRFSQKHCATCVQHRARVLPSHPLPRETLAVVLLCALVILMISFLYFSECLTVPPCYFP